MPKQNVNQSLEYVSVKREVDVPSYHHFFTATFKLKSKKHKTTTRRKVNKKIFTIELPYKFAALQDYRDKETSIDES